jgi:two-component system OmpR family sensor kinase
MGKQPAVSRAWTAIQELSGRMPLRVKLITAVLALVAIALATISIVGIVFLKSYLIGQADDSLLGLRNYGHVMTDQYLSGSPPSPQPGVAVDWIRSGRVAQIVRPGVASVFYQRSSPGPAVSAGASWLKTGGPVTVPAHSGSGRWRVIAFGDSFVPFTGPVSGTVVVGIDVTSVYNTIGRLTRVDLIVTAVVLVAIAAIGTAVVRASLRPLTEIEHTAGLIAAGDLTRRVPERDPGTEVGRLGRSLNAMLAQIESAFAARAASESAARRSEERMRRFVADASHELRTPLTAIRGFAEYYRQRGGVPDGGVPDGGAAEPPPPAEPAAPVGEPAGGAGPGGAGPGGAAAGPAEPNGNGPLDRADLDRIMRRVEQEAARMGLLVEDMLLLARLDQQRPLEFGSVDLLALAADAVNDARMIAPDRDIGLTVGTGAALLVRGDEVRLRQVIGNLMSNALTHTPDGTPIAVTIRSGTLDEAASRASAPLHGAVAHPAAPPAAQAPAVVLEVTDRGPGLSREQAEHVFERFYRGDKARTRKAGGTGLGLAIVSALVAAHGGVVWVRSAPGQGATFGIALPMAPEAAGDSAGDPRTGQQAAASPPAGQAAPPGSGRPDGDHLASPGEERAAKRGR